MRCDQWAPLESRCCMGEFDGIKTTPLMIGLRLQISTPMSGLTVWVSSRVLSVVANSSTTVLDTSTTRAVVSSRQLETSKTALKRTGTWDLPEGGTALMVQANGSHYGLV